MKYIFENKEDSKLVEKAYAIFKDEYLKHRILDIAFKGDTEYRWIMLHIADEESSENVGDADRKDIHRVGAILAKQGLIEEGDGQTIRLSEYGMDYYRNGTAINNLNSSFFGYRSLYISKKGLSISYIALGVSLVTLLITLISLILVFSQQRTNKDNGETSYNIERMEGNTLNDNELPSPICTDICISQAVETFCNTCPSTAYPHHSFQGDSLIQGHPMLLLSDALLLDA